MAMLVAMSGIASDRLKIRCKGSQWLERPKLWGALVASSGSGKSPIFRVATKEMRAINSELAGDNRIAMADYLARVREQESVKKSDRFDPGPPPPVRCLVVDNATIEWQQKVAEDNPRGICLLRGEMSSLIRSKDPKTHDKVLDMLEYYDGGQRDKGTLKDGQRDIKNWSAAFLTTVQPTAISKANEILLDTGFVQRFIPIPVPDKEWIEDDLQTDDSAYRHLCRRLWELDPPTDVIFELDLGARDLANAWLKKVHYMGRSQTISKQFSEHFAKYPAFFFRLVLLYHVIDMIENATSHEVTSETVRKVTDLMDSYIYPSSQHFYLSSFSGTGPAAVATKVCERLKTDAYLGTWSVTERSLVRNVRAFADADPDTRRKALQLLESHGWGRKSQEKGSNGKLMQTIQISPRVTEIMRAEDHRDNVAALDAAAYAAPGSPSDFY